MTRDDERDLPMSPSHEKYFSSADQGKIERKEQHAAGKGRLNALKRYLLRGRLQNDQKAIEKGEEKQDGQNESISSSKEPPSQTFGTKTREQALKKDVVSAEMQEDADALIDAGKRQQIAMDQAALEEQSDEQG